MDRHIELKTCLFLCVCLLVFITAPNRVPPLETKEEPVETDADTDSM